MDKTIVLLFLTFLLGVIVESYVVEVPKEEITDPKYSEDRSNVIKKSDESAVQFMIQWMNKAQKVPTTIPENFEKSYDSMIGDLYSRFNDTIPVAEITRDPNTAFSEEVIKPLSLNFMWFSEFGIKDTLMHSELRILVNQSDELVYVNSTFLPAFKSGWFSVDITDCYRHWMAHPEENHGIKLVLKVPKIRSELYYTVNANVAGVEDFEADVRKHPFLVNFYDKSKASEGYFEKLFWEKLMSSANETGK
ncbi:hypothetical protein KQX54_008728 [Cotesia glomerata]|uniref:TGF-beta propeptide domain-containing protein n=1 Tax=Cotesia glomerata TaxID=32391 RepID=A0AAV7IJU9_COTGL|nr:hypothetical protein KQX54_008728 [Cotesia glomerata]